MNADIGEIDVGFVGGPDQEANSFGVKGMGELMMTGAPAVIDNAVYHATGKRRRKLPVRIDDVL